MRNHEMVSKNLGFGRNACCHFPYWPPLPFARGSRPEAYPVPLGLGGRAQFDFLAAIYAPEDPMSKDS
jgi:hypothetical protein